MYPIEKILEIRSEMLKLVSELEKENRILATLYLCNLYMIGESVFKPKQMDSIEFYNESKIDLCYDENIYYKLVDKFTNENFFSTFKLFMLLCSMRIDIAQNVVNRWKIKKMVEVMKNKNKWVF